jgi:hypothetical protein
MCAFTGVATSRAGGPFRCNKTGRVVVEMTHAMATSPAAPINSLRACANEFTATARFCKEVNHGRITSDKQGVAHLPAIR